MGHEPNYTTVPKSGCRNIVKFFRRAGARRNAAVSVGLPHVYGAWGFCFARLFLVQLLVRRCWSPLERLSARTLGSFPWSPESLLPPALFPRQPSSFSSSAKAIIHLSKASPETSEGHCALKPPIAISCPPLLNPFCRAPIEDISPSVRHSYGDELAESGAKIAPPDP